MVKTATLGPGMETGDEHNQYENYKCLANAQVSPKPLFFITLPFLIAYTLQVIQNVEEDEVAES